MVSADNLNLDVLDTICSYLTNLNDLSSFALVSRSFLAAVLPQLYATLPFRISHAKRYPRAMTPFGAVIARPALAIHVRSIDIRAVPFVQGGKHNPKFLRECSRALSLCCNLSSFKCTTTALPSLLASLEGKFNLRDLWVRASITTEQSTRLLKLEKLSTLTLEFASWNMLDVLPKWTQSVRQTLTTLTLYMASDLNETVLDSALSNLPSLLALHVVRCQNVDHIMLLRLASHTPLLESLSFTVTENACPLVLPPPSLHHLHNLALDTRFSGISSQSPTILAATLSHIQQSSPPLTSFTIRLPEGDDQIGQEFIQQLLTAHGLTLKRLAFFTGSLAINSVLSICKACPHLERLDLPLPINQIARFTTAIAPSFSLEMIVDNDPHMSPGPRVSLTPENVRHMMENVRNLKNIVSEQRIWTGHREMDCPTQVTFERKPAHGTTKYWFMPHK